MIIIVSEISQVFNKAVSIPQLSIIFIGVFGLLRMFLEKANQQFLFNWRWNMYQDTVDNVFNGMIVMMATSYILAFYIKRGTFLEDIDDLLEKSLKELFRKPNSIELKERRAAHIVARKRHMTLEHIAQLKMHMDEETVHTALGFTEEPKVRVTVNTHKGIVQQFLTKLRQYKS